MFSTKRKSYRADFKLKVISKGKISEIQEAARLFSVDRKSAHEWRKGEKKVGENGQIQTFHEIS